MRAHILVVAAAALAGTGCNSVRDFLADRQLPWPLLGVDSGRRTKCAERLEHEFDWLGAAYAADSMQAAPAAARVVYVSSLGDDAADGSTEEQAFQTIERVNREALKPGDRVLLRGGDRFDGTLRLEQEDAGTAVNPVVIASFGEGRAHIEAGASSAIEIINAGGIVVRDLVLHGAWDADAQAGNTGFGVHAVNSTGSGLRLSTLRFVDLDISGFRESGISLDAEPADEKKGNGFENVVIARSDVHDNGDTGIVTGGPYSLDPGYSHRAILIDHVRVYRNRGIAQKAEHTGSGIVLADVDSGVVRRCVAHDNGDLNMHAPGGGFGIWAWDSNAIVIEHNESHHNRSQTADGGGFDLDGGTTHSVIQYNYSHDNHGAGVGAYQFAYARPYGANTVRYNVSQNDGLGISLWDDNGDLGAIVLHNNAVYGHAAALRSFSPLASVLLLQNVFAGTGPTLVDAAVGKGLTLQANAYFADGVDLHIAWNSAGSSPVTYASLDDYARGTGQEKQNEALTGLAGDPGLLNAGGGPTFDDAELLDTLDAYQLTEGSPLVDRGLDPSVFGLDPGCQDFFENPIPKGRALDIGVHELR